MKLLSTIGGRFLVYLDRHGVFAEIMSYDDIYKSVPEDELYDALLVDVSDGKAEGVITPRSLINKGHTLPIIGVIDDMELADERDFEFQQATFIDQGGLYLLKKSASPELVKAYVAQAATIGGRRHAQRMPVRTFSSADVVLKVDLRTHRVYVNQTSVHLTVHEYLMLELLAMRTGSVVTKEAFLGHLYSGIDLPEIKIIDVFLCKLRKKLGKASVFVETVWGRGYSLIDDTQQENAAA